MVLKIGTNGNDTLNGSFQADILLGSAGNDVLYGSRSADYLHGGHDDDVLWGGNGADTLVGSEGNDTLEGGGGIDTMVFGTNTDVYVDSGTATVWEGDLDSGLYDTDRFFDIENVITGDGDDYVNYNAGYQDIGNVIETNGGNDWVGGYSGDDTINTGSGHDTLFAGTGIDILTGGPGADDFIFLMGEVGSERDVITDFNPAVFDEIDLTGFGDLVFIGEAAFTAPNQISFSHIGDSTIVSINTVGNTGVEMQIELSGLINLAAGDFIL